MSQNQKSPGEMSQKGEMSQNPKTPDELDKTRGFHLLLFFVAVLVVSNILYVGLHLWRPAGPLSTETTVLALIEKADTTLAAVQSDTVSPEVRTAILELTGQIKILAPSLSVSQEISSTVKDIETELAQTAPHRAELSTLVKRLQNVMALNQRYYFWSGNSDRWIEMAFWSLFGTLIFLLSEIKKYYTMPFDSSERSENKRDFTAFTPWYIVNLFRGPFIALCILFALSGISLDIVGVTLDIKQAPIVALIFLAAILGFYSRVAEKQLDSIMDRLFHDAAVRAGLLPLVIKPDNVTIRAGGRILFKVQPDQPVTWLLKGNGKLEDGSYTAPESIGDAEEATVWAISEKDNSDVARAKVTLQGTDKGSGAASSPTGDVRVLATPKGNGANEPSPSI